MALAGESWFLPNIVEWSAIAGSYLLGALPFGLILARVVKGVDVRAVGSGNIGATNTMRVMGRGWGVFAFALDFLKGWVPVVFVASAVSAEAVHLDSLRVICGAAAVLGHCFPVYLAFRGGKGVATGCGAIVGLDPMVFVLGGAVWLVTLGLFRFVGLASVAMGLAFPVAAWFRQGDAGEQRGGLVVGTLLLLLLILVRHRANIARTLAGTEPRIGQNGPGSTAP